MSNVSRTSRVILPLVLSACLALGALTAPASEDDSKEHSKKVTLVGEVLDLYCYMRHPEEGMGPGHAKCAKSCIRKGLPIGFLSDGEVYLLIGKDHESAKDLVVDFAGGQARLKGTLIEHHGVKSIEVETVEKVKSSGAK